MKTCLLFCTIIHLFATLTYSTYAHFQTNGLPISSVIEHDGSLKRGIYQAVSSKGLPIRTLEDGSPRFMPNTTAETSPDGGDCSDRWDGRFWSNGVSGIVWATAVDGNGNVYVAGNFLFAGNQRVNNVAKWDGASWSALGSGLEGNETGCSGAFAIAVSGDDVYVGGCIRAAGVPGTEGLAKWDGTSWSAVGSGLTGVFGDPPSLGAIAISGTDVYVGGNLSAAGGVPANFIAKWDGAAWSALGEGTNGTVLSFAVSGSDVYVGGFFGFAGPGAANNIAKWDGTNWSALGEGVPGGLGVETIAILGSDVYAGGNFLFPSGNFPNWLAKWNGSSWSAVGSGIAVAQGSGVMDLHVSGTDLYVGGQFDSAGGVSGTRNIAKWDGSNWSEVMSFTDFGYAGALTMTASGLYIGGLFYALDGEPSANIGLLTGGVLSGLGSSGQGIYGEVGAIAPSGEDVYVAGTFQTVGDIAANNIAKWNGSQWSPLGSGVDGFVDTMAVSGSDVYVGGRITAAGGLPVNRIAKWDGSSWTALGDGLNGNVVDIAVLGTDVYVGGSFTTAGGVSANRIAKWNGTVWEAVGSGVTSTGSVAALAISGTDIYAAGSFTAIGDVPANRVAKWNGSTWSALGNGVGPGVFDIAIVGNNVYIGGFVTSAGGGVPVNRIAKWNGSEWSALGSGLNDIMISFAVSGSDLYVGGLFSSAGGIPGTNGLARWDGSGWSAVDEGVGGPFTQPQVYELAASNSKLHVGGLFTTAGCHGAASFSIYSLARKARFDFDGDGRSDVSVFRPSQQVWYLDRSTEGLYATQFGLFADKLTPADHDGDGKTDIAVFRDGIWYWINSSDGSFSGYQFGLAGDIPVPADYTGDGRDELAIYRDGAWWMLDLATGQARVELFGIAGDRTVAADYDGDGSIDQAVYRNGDWHLNRSGGGYTVINFGLAGDTPVVGDYDGDARADLAVFRPLGSPGGLPNSAWYVLQSSDGLRAYQFGNSTETPAAADYDGDGRTDVATFAHGSWAINQSSAGPRFFRFGLTDDKALASAYLP